MSKKPRNKSYKPHRIDIPMMRETRDGVALALHAAIETLIHRPDIDAYNVVSINLMTIGRACGLHDCIESAKQAMLDIYARYERIERMGVNVGEATALRQAAGAMDRLLAGVPVNRWVDADIRTARQCSAMFSTAS